MTSRAYVDASAFVKLFVNEPESGALRGAIRGSLASSDLLAIETCRVAMRIGGEAPAMARRALQDVSLVPLDAQVRDRAGFIGPPGLRPLDAIHLATADLIREEIDALVTYDRRLTEAAEALGIPVLSPR